MSTDLWIPTITIHSLDFHQEENESRCTEENYDKEDEVDHDMIDRPITKDHLQEQRGQYARIDSVFHIQVAYINRTPVWFEKRCDVTSTAAKLLYHGW
jgi:hypothetical protein